MSDSVRPHRWQPTRLPHPWDSPGKNTGVGCHFLLQCMKVKSDSEVDQLYPTLRHHGLQPTRLLRLWDFSRQECWSGVPLPSPILAIIFWFNIVVVVQLLSHVQLCNPTDCSIPRLPCSSQSLLKLMPIKSLILSSHLICCLSFLPLPSIFPSIRSFAISRLFTSGGQSIEASASALVLPMNIQGCLGLTGLISLMSKGLSRVFSSTTIQKHQFLSVQLYLWPNSHIYTWLLKKS